jgi:hypothetical protein
MAAPYFLARWNGMAFEPLPRDRSACLAQYEVGRCYRMTEHQERSAESHNHEFAEVDEAWQNLPDHLRDEFPSPTHLRRHALCRKGFCSNKQLVLSSREEALRVAPFIRQLDDYSLISVRGCVVTVLTAFSQSKRAMGKAQFERSKQAVLDFCAELIGTDPGTLSRETGKAA